MSWTISGMGLTEMGHDSLRERAEEQLAESADSHAPLSNHELSRLVHELRIHQTELEMQNDELVRTQQELQITLERLSDLYDHAPLGYVTVNAHGAIIEANLTAADLMQTPRIELVGSWFSQLLSAGDADVLYEHYSNVRRHSDAPFCELTIRKDGVARNVRLNSVLVNRGEKDTPIRIAITDITDQRKAELQNAAINERLNDAQRMSSIGAIASGVAHDFNNLLVPILLHTQLLSTELDEDSPQQKHFESITAAANTATDLCTQMLEYAGSGESEKTSLHLSEFVLSHTTLLESLTGDGVQIVFRCNDLVPAIDGDSTQLRRVLMNLVTNASEAIGGRADGVIVISIESVYLNEDDIRELAFKEHPVRAGEYVFIDVSDNGCGMDQDTLQRIFDPFFSTKTSGRGLGMAAVFGITRSHSAAVKIESRQGNGTTMRIFFRATGRDIDASGSDNDRMDVVKGVGTILIVDDNPLVSQATTSVFQSVGYKVITAASGSEAVEICRMKGDSIDLVIVDYVMPEMDGITTLREISAIAPKLLTFLTSGGSKDGVLAKLGSLKIDGFVSKPYRIGDLTHLIREAISLRNRSSTG